MGGSVAQSVGDIALATGAALLSNRSGTGLGQAVVIADGIALTSVEVANLALNQLGQVPSGSKFYVAPFELAFPQAPKASEILS